MRSQARQQVARLREQQPEGEHHVTLPRPAPDHPGHRQATRAALSTAAPRSRFRQSELENGIRVLGASGVAVENITAINYTVNGFYRIEADGYRASYLTAQRNNDYGVYAFDSVNGLIEHVYAARSPDAGIYIGQCYFCNAVLNDVWAWACDQTWIGTQPPLRDRVGVRASASSRTRRAASSSRTCRRWSWGPRRSTRRPWASAIWRSFPRGT
jgi:hypothetical protein